MNGILAEARADLQPDCARGRDPAFSAVMSHETFWRGDELAREARMLPATTYNLAHTLLTRSPNGCVFVPIRAMQYLAIVDQEEVIFLDGQGTREIEISWQEFRPKERASLTDPVPYQAAYYSLTARGTMLRLQGEFFRALQLLESRQTPHEAARVIRIESRKKPR